MAMSDLEKLRVLLPHWVEHNEEHNKEFRKWAERARAEGQPEAHDELLTAVDLIEKANASLRRAQALLSR